MRDTIQLRCGKCGHVHHYNSHFIKGVLKGMKMDKAREVAQQMADKRGPFYDKWKAAMEKRGEQNRCTDCLWLYRQTANPRYQVRSCYGMGRRDGQFACGHYIVDPATV